MTQPPSVEFIPCQLIQFSNSTESISRENILIWVSPLFFISSSKISLSHSPRFNVRTILWALLLLRFFNIVSFLFFYEELLHLEFYSPIYSSTFSYSTTFHLKIAEFLTHFKFSSLSLRLVCFFFSKTKTLVKLFFIFILFPSTKIWLIPFKTTCNSFLLLPRRAISSANLKIAIFVFEFQFLYIFYP